MVEQESAQHRRNLKSKVARYALIAAVVAVILAAWGVGSRILARSELRKATTENAVLTVVTAKPQLSSAGNELVLPGIVQAYTESPIYARTNGYLKIWHTDIGARVHQGQLLAEIDTPEASPIASSLRRARISTPHRPTSRSLRSPTTAGRTCSRRRPSRSKMPTTVRAMRPPRRPWSNRRSRT